MMSSKELCAVILLVFALTFSAAQTNCKERCGTEYYRGFMCQCDYNCLSYGECCKDYESQCTTKNSCKGRCGEAFKRGRLCSCDSDCMKYKQCCPDYKTHCDEEEPTLTEETSFTDENYADDYLNSVDGPTSYPPGDYSDDVYSPAPSTDEFSISGVEDLDVSPIPGNSSGNGPSTADQLDQVPTKPTLDTDVEFTTEAPFSPTEPTLSDDNLSMLNSTSGDATSAITDAGDLKPPAEEGVNPPQLTTTANQLNSTSVPQTAPTLSTPEIDTDIPPLGEPEITINNTQDSNTVVDFSQVTTIPASSTVVSTVNPEEATSNPSIENISESVTTDPPSLLANLEDPSTNVPPAEAGDASQLDAVSTHTPSVQDDITDGVKPEVPTADPVKISVEMTSPPTSKPTSKPQEKPKPRKPLPTSKPETKPFDTQTLATDNPRYYQADDSNDTNLCSGWPVSAVTTMRNGTIVVFRGHYFWFLDRNRVPSPAQSITQVWGVPSPIDTVFTRCNCQGKTYIFKGGKYWRFENDVIDPGFPKFIKTGFDGLQGHITAALSVPQYRNRRESVYFFKRGGFVQKYSYQFGTSPTCGRKVHIPIYTVHTRRARQAVSVLEPAIKIQTSWRGFPSPITAAVSVPNNRQPEGYNYFVVSRSTFYSVRMEGERPVIAAPTANTSPQTSNFFRCPQKT
ncbi:proteoglycan 4b isoform X2 [Melanotaenia boesemani]|uniref:proteoglycan 4b isoform X2 n=1 Tax=Melanotaenia boesemani TaxID=1250792 RepID=UPI001C051787|nr:proteoglycan 4b isoform X2 [Melanotaenia boesemani]